MGRLDFAGDFRGNAPLRGILPRLGNQSRHHSRRRRSGCLGYGPRKSTGVHDRIYHRVMALDDGRTQFFLVSSDLCLFSPELYDEVASALQQAGIERKQFWWSVTHTHSAPEVGPPGVYKVLLKGRSDHEWDREYTAQIKSSVVQAVKDARDKLEPARLRTGLGMSLANINRRAKDVDGKDQPRPQSRWPRGPADRPDPPRAPRWLADRAGRELRHSRHRPERRQHRDQRRRARHRHRVSGEGSRCAGALRQRRRRQCRAHLLGVSHPVGRPSLRVPRPARRPHPGGQPPADERLRRHHASPG